MARRDGFTLIELLMVVVIIGILATVAVNGLQRGRTKALYAAVRNDLRVLAVQQEKYFGSEFVYAGSLVDIPDFAKSPGVDITITHTGPSTWAATGSHIGLTPGEGCGIFIGAAPAGIAPPATSEAVVTCTE